MAMAEPNVGPVQIIVVGFESTERFRGEIARELVGLHGHGMVRVLDARLFHRAPAGKLTEVDLNPLIGAPQSDAAPVARLLGLDGTNGNGGMPPAQAFARVSGFAVDDLRRLVAEVGPGEYVAVVLVEHLWATRLREVVRDAGGQLLGQGLLTPELIMLAGAEIQVRAEAQKAIELAQAARGAALVDALMTVAERGRASPQERSAAAAEVVRVLVAGDFVDETDAPDAIDALAAAGLVDPAALRAAIADAEQLLARLEENEPPPD
jgi:hypothetical protein